MNDGLIKVAAATPGIRVADCEFNSYSAAECVKIAAAAGVRILVLPELCITGYNCGDLFQQQVLLEGAMTGLDLLCRQTKTFDMIILAGLPVRCKGKLYNCAAVIDHGHVLAFVPKTRLPNYGEFQEIRYFSPGFPGLTNVPGPKGESVPMGTDILFCCRELPELIFAIEICEDLWAPCPPSIRHTAAGALIIANLSASDEVAGKAQIRRNLVCGQSARLVCGYLYADAGEGESTTDLVFAGHNIIAESGELLAQSKLFHNEMAISEIDVRKLESERRHMNTFYVNDDESHHRIFFSMQPSTTLLTRAVSPTPFLPTNIEEQNAWCESILSIQAEGLKKRMAYSRAKTAVIGLSGGLDSTLALLVTIRAMKLMQRPESDIFAVTMPCFGTTARTKGNAERLAVELGIRLHTVDIQNAVDMHFHDVGHDPKKQDATYENAQARERTQILMDLANETSGLVVGTGDLSELALGWATYNGDHMSMYGVNAGVPKTLVQRLVAYEADICENEVLGKILDDILETPVSPELLPPKEGEIAQKTEDLVGPYLLHDFFLYYFLRWNFPPRKILRLAKHVFEEYDEKTIEKWLKIFCKRFFQQQYKRSCLPDGPKVLSISLSPRGDWRMPSDAEAALWLRDIETF